MAAGQVDPRQSPISRTAAASASTGRLGTRSHGSPTSIGYWSRTSPGICPTRPSNRSTLGSSGADRACNPVDTSIRVDGAGVGLDVGEHTARALAAFHLDRLVKAGLLETEYRRLSGRTGPGAGRPATRASAQRAGESVGAQARAGAGRLPTRRRLGARLLAALRERGYEPRGTEDGRIRFGNCPYHTLVEDHRQLVCGMNLAVAEGTIAGLGDDRISARLDPQPGLCCVALSESPAHPPAM